jgi:hypothetical protein
MILTVPLYGINESLSLFKPILGQHGEFVEIDYAIAI